MVDEATEIGKNWWLFVVLGVICVVTGVLAIVWPGLTLLTLGIFAGIYLLATRAGGPSAPSSASSR